MKFSKTLLAAAALVASFGANAAITFSSVAASPGDYISTGDVYAHSGGGSTQTTSVVDTYLKPLYDTNNYFVVTKGETVTFTLAANTTEFNFLWGSPDPSNAIAVNGSLLGDGTTLLGALVATSDNAQTQWSRITATRGDFLNTIAFSTGQIAFETAVANPVPEPETYALMLAGLGAMAFVARRRKNA
ncbi:MAG: PEP-CTERM sorting domain-containing protein [Pseudomonadota bacterium]